MERTTINLLTQAADITRLTAAIVQNANYKEQCREIAELYTQEASEAMNQTIRVLNFIIKKQCDTQR